MKLNFWSLILLLLWLNTLCFAEMYTWVDDNGVKHFTDTPPNSNTVSPDKVKKSKTSKYVFKHKLYKKEGKLEFCGNYQLPIRKSKDIDRYLIDVKQAYDNAIYNRGRLVDELASTSDENYRKDLQRLIDEYECAAGWATSTLKEIENKEQ